MKHIALIRGILPLVTALGAALLFPGCATTPDSGASTPAPAPTAVVAGIPSTTNVPLRKDKDIEGVWLAPGFNFKGYDGLYVADTVFAATVRANEEKERSIAIGAVQRLIVEYAQSSGLFPTVAAGAPPATGHNLVLKNTIIKYEKGGGAARYFAGIYGGGQPHTRVRGEMFDGGKLVFVYVAERSGEGGGARMLGAYKSDDDIQTNDIRDLALDLADCMKRNAGAP